MKKIVIYTTSVCPYCVNAKTLLKNKNLDFEEIAVNDEKMRNAMIEKAGGARTVPQIFIGDQHIGGYDQLYALDQSGELSKLVKE